MPLITLNGIERIGKQYYSGILNKHLKALYGNDYQIRKFSFPSYSTKTGQKLAQLIRQFRKEDLFYPTKNTHFRYRRLAEFFMENVIEYRHLVDIGRNNGDNSISLVNNHYHYSIIAHGLAAGMRYLTLRNMLKNNNSPPHLAYFLVTKNVRKMLTEPLKTHEIYSSFSYQQQDEIAPDTFSDDYINYFTMVNNYYKQIYLTNTFQHPESKFILVEIDPDDIHHITKTVEKIRCEAESFFRGVQSAPDKRS